MSPRILIADQDVKLARLYGAFLSDHGMVVETAASGLECLTLVRLQAPDVLVLDHELPWHDAAGVLACLREDGLSLPVLLTTWSASAATVRRLVAPPVVRCLRKFFPLPTLLDSVHSAFLLGDRAADCAPVHCPGR
jgi:CheY-like chemotaxis protein